MSNDPQEPANASQSIDLGPPYALYTLVELGDQEITDIEAECNSDTFDGCFHVRRAPSWYMHGQTLRAAFRDFITNVQSSGQFENSYFVAVVDRDWKSNGVALVAVEDEEDDTGDPTFDKMTVPLADVGHVLLHLSTANMGWWDFQEVYGRSEWEDGMMAPADKPFDRHQTDEEYSDGSATKLPSVGYWIGIYAIDGVDFETAMRYIEDDEWKSVNRLTCRPQGRLPDTTREETIAEAARLHPMRCRNNPRLHRTMFFVIDTLKGDDDVKNEDDGVLLVRINWDQDINPNPSRSLIDLARIGSTSRIECQRLRYNDTILKTFKEINEGLRPWRHEHKAFFAYAGPRHSGRSDVYLRALDRSFASREYGSARFLQGWTRFDTDAVGRIIEDGKEAFETVLRQHWGFVHQERFNDSLVPEFLVYCDRRLTSLDTYVLVTLVKVQTDADGVWSAMPCRAGEVYETLCALAAGTREWKGKYIVPEE